MRKVLPILIVAFTILSSCEQREKSTPVKVLTKLEQSKIVLNTENKTPIVVSNQKNIDTRYEYIDSNGHYLIIENSYPKGGLKYTDPNGEKHVYAVFWTRITNETNSPFELTMEFSEDSYKLPSSPGRFFKLFIPSDTMTTWKEPLFNYGLYLEKYLDDNFDKQAEIKRTIYPKGSSGFYVVTLFNKGVEGRLRTGLSIKQQNLFYRINDIEIQSGKINLKKLKLDK